MNILKSLGLSCLLISILPVSAFAQTCDQTISQADSTVCTQQRMAYLSNEIKQKYQSLKHRLTVNQQKRLQYSQLAWMNQRDKVCGGETLRSENRNCQVKELEARENWLSNHILNCKENNCQTIAMDR